MDTRYLHHNRYVSHPPPQQPPQPPPAPETPNFYNHHHSNLLSSPFHPPQPPPPQMSYTQFQNPQFSYNPNEINHNRDSFQNPRFSFDFPQSSRVIYPPQFDEHSSRLHVNQPYGRETQPNFRVLSDTWQTSSYNPKLDNESYSRRFDSQYKPKSKRVIDDLQFVPLHGGDESYYRRSQGSHMMSRDFRAASSQSSHELCGNYKDRREIFYDPGKGNKIEMERERERLSSRASREGSYEFNRNSRKIVQKKSAFQRIQKPYYRNREDGRRHHPTYWNDSKYAAFKGKDQNFRSGGDGVGEPVREKSRDGEVLGEKSLIKLDVSFKSNSLVCKAIANPLLNLSAPPGIDYTSRISKGKKVSVLDRDYTSIAKETLENVKFRSSVIVPNTESNSAHDDENRETAKLKSSISVPNTESSACQDLKQSVKEIPSCGLVNASSNSLVAASTGTNISTVRSKTESSSKVSEKSGTNVVSGKKPSLKAAKNRKVVKRVVRKVANGKMSSKSSQPLKKSVLGKLSGDVVYVRSPPASDKADNAASMDSVDNSDSQPRPTNAKKVANAKMISKSLPQLKKAVEHKPTGDFFYVQCPPASSKPDNAASMDSVDNSDPQPRPTDAKNVANSKMCSRLQPVKKSVVPTPAGDFVDVNCSPASNKLDKPASIDSDDNSDSQPCPTGALKDKDDKLRGVANCMTLDHGSTSSDSSWEALDGGINECSNIHVYPIGHEDIKSVEISSKCHSVNELQVIPHLGDGISKQRNETMYSNVSKVEGVIKQPSESGNCFLSDTTSVKATPKVLLLEEDKPKIPNENVVKQAFESGNPSLSDDKSVCETSEVLVPQEDMHKQLNVSMSSNISKVKDVIKQPFESGNCFSGDDKSVFGTSEVLVSQEDLSKQLNASMLESKVEDVAKQPVVVSGNDSANGNPELLLSQEDNCDFDLNLEKSDGSEGLTNVCGTNMKVDICLTKSKEKITDSEIDDIAGCEMPSTGQGSSSANTGSGGNQVQNTGVSSKPLSPSYAGESEVHKMDPSVGFSNWKEGSILDSNGCNILSVNEISNRQNGIDVGSLSSPDGAVISLKTLTIEEGLNDTDSRDANKEDASDPSPNISTAKIPELDLLVSEASKTMSETVNIPTLANWIDTTLRLSTKRPTVGKTGIIGDECDIGSLKHCVDNVNVLNTSSSTVLEAKVSVSNSVNAAKNLISSGNSKKRKNSCAYWPEFYNSIQLGINDGPVLSMSTPCRSEKSSAKHEYDAGSLELDPLCVSDMPPLKKGISRLHRHHSVPDYFDTVDSDRPMSEDDDGDNREVLRSCAVSEEMVFAGANTTCSTEPRDDHIIDATPISNATCRENNDSMDTDNDGGGKIDLDNAKEQVSLDGMTTLSHIPLEHSPGLEERLSDTDTGNEKHVGAHDDLLMLSNKGSVSGDSYRVSVTSSSDGLATDISFLSCPEILSASRGISPGQGTVLKVFGLDGRSNEKCEIEGISNLSNAKSIAKSTCIRDDHVVNEMTRSISLGFKSKTRLLNVSSRKFDRSKNQHDHTASKTYRGVSSSHTPHSRTWRRIDSSVSASPSKKALSMSNMQWQLSDKGSKLESSSYIRKGNSLVRNSYPVISQTQGSRATSISTSKRNSSDKGRITGAGTEYGIDDISRGKNASPERPTSSPLTNNKSSLQNYISSASAEPLHGPAETSTEHTKVTESSNMVLSSDGKENVSETQVTHNGQNNDLESYGEQNNGNLVSENVKAVRYLKRKSNQLVAYPVDTDGYYKRQKNQLIRTSQGELKQADDISDESISKGQTTNFVPSRSSSMRQLRKAVTKTSSLVWTLNGAQLSKSNVSTLHHQNVLPHLFPWKRATYWRTIFPASASNVNCSSFTVTGRKLLLLRKRDTVYTKSKYGFSLRKSKVLSVGGSSLKWSKSIESHSKKANEEATLAVALVERKKREQNASASVASSGAKYKKDSTRKSGERIFCIGSVHYRMDSSRRTLQRISDDESGTSTPQSDKDAKKCFIPRRLIIGKDEYIRIGNGNQLVRDPKKRFRILASEKVRWSLHTVRSRWARKRKYCQFFTRYGKCDKADGKCPYIHDSSKIAVCTKFLKGLCSNASCKLTHEIIPERMPDCSYFLQGLCSNRHCPYRHVHVNPNASTCEGFLRGYCADGNECRKKHSYVCPVFEATGSCPQGSKCKLHHPKTKTKGKKSKRARAKKSSQGRYFGLMQHRFSEPANAVSEKHQALASNVVDESPADYISLDVSDEEAEDEYNATEEGTTSNERTNGLSLKSKNIDELIRPVRILNSQMS